MTIYLKQSTAGQEVTLGYLLDSTDGNTEETGLTIANTDIKLHKTGATTLANKNSGGATHISNGIYYAVLDATDTNTLGSLVIYCHPTGALATKVDCVVLAANVYDSLIGGEDLLDVSTTQLAGQTVTAAAGVTFPTSIASPTNITSAAGCAVSSIGTNVITATSIAASALNGKGNWNVGKTGYSLTATTGLGNQTSNITGTITTVTNLTNLPATAATAASIAALNNLSAAQVNAEVDTALADYDAPTNTEMVAAFTEIKGATWATTDTLEAIRDRGDAAWVTGAGGSAPSAADIRAEIDANSTQLAAIVADTNELQTNQGNWLTATGFATSSALSAIDSKIGTPSVTLADDIAGISAGSGLDAAGVRAAIGLASANLDTQLSTIDTVVDGIQADLSNGTDGLGALSADIAGISAGSGLTAQEVRDALKLAPTAGAPAAGSIDAHLDTIEADTNELQSNQGNWLTATGFATSGALSSVASDVSAVLTDTGTTIPAQISALNDFNPSVDVVANVTLVDTCTTNTDMRGTDNAATAANLATTDGKVDNIKAKTDQLAFTVSNELNVNVQSINDVTLVGDGVGTPMGA
jgi:hypothetical protein